MTDATPGYYWLVPSCSCAPTLVRVVSDPGGTVRVESFGTDWRATPDDLRPGDQLVRLDPQPAYRP